MDTSTRFREYNPDHLMLLPPDLREWLPKGHCAYFILDLIPELDLSEIFNAYDGTQGGQPPYDPRMMVGLLLFAYGEGVTSSRRIEQATYDSVAYRVLSVDQHPDHDTVSSFRQHHLGALSALFTQVLGLCQKAGLVKLGHVALDGTKVKANASKHKAMSYGRMKPKVSELEAEVKRLLAEAEATDAAEDALYGNELPEELRFREGRLKKIRAAMAELEAEAAAEYPSKKADYEEKVKNRKQRGGRGKKPKPPSKEPDPKKQRNFTDTDSRMMVSKDTFVQAYNCQAAVDGKAQIIVAADVTQDANDKNQVVSMVEKIKAHMAGELPRCLTADNGYFNEKQIDDLQFQEIDTYIATEKYKHGETKPACPRGRIPKAATTKERMARKLLTLKGRCTYAKRKEIVEPVFGQIKALRRLDRFSFRGLKKVTAEWNLICLTHNLLKLYRSNWQPKPA